MTIGDFLNENASGIAIVILIIAYWYFSRDGKDD